MTLSYPDGGFGAPFREDMFTQPGTQNTLVLSICSMAGLFVDLLAMGGDLDEALNEDYHYDPPRCPPTPEESEADPRSSSESESGSESDRGVAADDCPGADPDSVGSDADMSDDNRGTDPDASAQKVVDATRQLKVDVADLAVGDKSGAGGRLRGKGAVRMQKPDTDRIVECTSTVDKLTKSVKDLEQEEMALRRRLVEISSQRKARMTELADAKRALRSAKKPRRVTQDVASEDMEKRIADFASKVKEIRDSYVRDVVQLIPSAVQCRNMSVLNKGLAGSTCKSRLTLSAVVVGSALVTAFGKMMDDRVERLHRTTKAVVGALKHLSSHCDSVSVMKLDVRKKFVGRRWAMIIKDFMPSKSEFEEIIKRLEDLRSKEKSKSSGAGTRKGERKEKKKRKRESSSTSSRTSKTQKRKKCPPAVPVQMTCTSGGKTPETMSRIMKNRASLSKIKTEDDE